MANEFIIKNGFRSQGNSEITGALTMSTTNQINFYNSSYFIKAASGLELHTGGGDVINFWSGVSTLGTWSTTGLGIGTTSPLSRLQVRGSGATSATTALRVENTNASASLVVLDNGNVGIGANTPISLLQIGSGSGFLGDFTTPAITFDNINNGIYLDTNRISFKSGGGFSFSTDSNGILGNGFRINSALFNDLTTPIFVPTRIDSGPASGYGGNNAGHLSLITNNTPRLYIDFSGSVGIGTISPSASLHISGSSGSALLEIDSPTVNNILFVTGSGNVGIGTGNPLVSLDIRTSNNSVITPLSTVPNNATTLLVGNVGTNGVLALGQNNAGQTWLQGRSRLGDGSSQPILLNPLGGNILIGTTTDAGYKLDVNGNTRINGNLRVNNILGDTGNLVIESANSQTYVQIKPKVGNTDGVRIETDQTDVGTSGEFASFRVIGPIFSPTTGSRTRNFISVTPIITQTGGANGITRGLHISASIISASDWRAIETTTGSVLFNGGNVGIGTTTPTSRLTVSGSAGTGSAIYAYKSGSTVLDIQGSQGQLFSVVDALSGSLMSVNDVSGLPILEVFSDDKVVMGTYGAPALIVTGSNTIISGSLRGRVVTLSTASATASMDCSLSNFFDLTLSGSMYLGVSNIQPGETINLRITQPATSGSLNYTSSIKFPNGLPYSASATSSVVDLISFISFDSSTLYATSLKNLI